MHRDPTGRWQIEPSDLYVHHEHVYKVVGKVEPPESCHTIEGLVCAVEGCGSNENRWPETGEFIRAERDERGEYVLTMHVWRHFTYAATLADHLDGIYRQRAALGLPSNLKGFAGYRGEDGTVLPPKSDLN